MANTKYNPANAGRSDFDRLFSAADDTEELVNEVHTARGAHSSLDDRLDAADSNVAEIQSDITTNVKPDIEVLKDDVETAEKGIARLTDKTAKNKLNTVYLAAMKTYNTEGSWSGNTYTIDGLEFEVEQDGTIEVTGTHDTIVTRFYLPVPTLAAGTYAISGCPASGSATKYCLRLKDGITEQYVNDYGEGEVFPIATAQPLSVEIKIALEYNSTVELTFKPMICLRDEFQQSDKYVPYCPTQQEAYLESLALEGDLNDEESARSAADTKQTSALTGIINGGSKNRATVSDTSGTRNVVIPVNLPAGEYIISFGEIASTDTDASVCRLALADATDTAVWTGGTTRGEDKSISVTLEAAAASLYVYASDNYSHSGGDTVTVTNLMICTKAEWDISQAFVPYCPTMPELYAMIQALGGGNRSISESDGEEER